MKWQTISPESFDDDDEAQSINNKNNNIFAFRLNCRSQRIKRTEIFMNGCQRRMGFHQIKITVPLEMSLSGFTRGTKINS